MADGRAATVLLAATDATVSGTKSRAAAAAVDAAASGWQAQTLQQQQQQRAVREGGKYVGGGFSLTPGAFVDA